MKTTFIFRFILLAGITITIGSQSAHAQFLKKLAKHVKEAAQEGVDQATTNHAVNDAGNATDKVITKGENAVGNATKGKNGSNGNNNADANTDSNNSSNTSANNTGNQTAAAPATPSIKSYQNYDFVPGDTILFEDNFADDQDGEFPSHWDLTKGQAVVNTVAGKKAFLLTEGNYCHVLPLMKTTSYLGNAFTIEFDTYTDGNGNESPSLFLNYTDKDGNLEDGEVAFARGDDEGRGEVDISDFPHDGLNANFPDELKKNYTNKWHHCAIAYKNGQVKVYVDQYRILTQPSLGCTPTSFWMGGIGDQNHPIVITNIRLASGGNMNMIGKKFTEAKIVTHGITFDIDKSDLKPQSMGTLNMIVKIMKNNPDLKFEIDGHTDNTGEAAHNATLSQQRADAVKAQLIKMGIDGSRLTTKGFGDTQPISDNSTPEGRANNRRVEFVRL